MSVASDTLPPVPTKSRTHDQGKRFESNARFIAIAHPSKNPMPLLLRRRWKHSIIQGAGRGEAEKTRVHPTKSPCPFSCTVAQSVFFLSRGELVGRGARERCEGQARMWYADLLSARWPRPPSASTPGSSAGPPPRADMSPGTPGSYPRCHPSPVGPDLYTKHHEHLPIKRPNETNLCSLTMLLLCSQAGPIIHPLPSFSFPLPLPAFPPHGRPRTAMAPLWRSPPIGTSGRKK